MSSFVSYLITVLYGDELVRCALKIDANKLPEWECIMSDEAKTHLHTLLPLHVRSCGPIVEIEEIFECVVMVIP